MAIPKFSEGISKLKNYMENKSHAPGLCLYIYYMFMLSFVTFNWSYQNAVALNQLVRLSGQFQCTVFRKIHDTEPANERYLNFSEDNKRLKCN